LDALWKLPPRLANGELKNLHSMGWVGSVRSRGIQTRLVSIMSKLGLSNKGRKRPALCQPQFLRGLIPIALKAL